CNLSKLSCFLKAMQIAKILIAEDHPVIQKVIKISVQRLGFEPYLCHNGLEVLQALSSGDFALILMDLQMPVLHGLDAARRIRENEQTTGKRIPIIALSAMGVDANDLFQAGIDDYILKPVDSSELSQKMDRWSLTSSGKRRVTSEPRSTKDDTNSI